MSKDQYKPWWRSDADPRESPFFMTIAAVMAAGVVLLIVTCLLGQW